MKTNKLLILFLFSFILFNSCSDKDNIKKVVSQKTQHDTSVPSSEIIEIVKRVNGYWQALHVDHGNAFWHRAVYHIGNVAAYNVTGIEDYRKYSEIWAEKNGWRGAESDNVSEWKYSTYGESNDYVLFGDWQVCFQAYIDLYNLNPDSIRIERAKEVMSYQISTANNDYWWWADGLYMSMPLMTKMYKITGDDRYLVKLYDYFSYAKKMMYDPDSGLFYRDARYVYPKHRTNNGLKDFWVGGNGWAFAAIAKTLEDLPISDPHRNEYIQVYQLMAKKLVDAQDKDGYWTRSILDPDYAPGPETSGTACFTYGLLCGINNGLLDEEVYLPTVNRAWRYLTETALQPDGRIGYVQPAGENYIPEQVIDANSTADFGVGAFLLAASEMTKCLR